jgi:hypothetical protein
MHKETTSRLFSFLLATPIIIALLWSFYDDLIPILRINVVLNIEVVDEYDNPIQNCKLTYQESGQRTYFLVPFGNNWVERSQLKESITNSAGNVVIKYSESNFRLKYIHIQDKYIENFTATKYREDNVSVSSENHFSHQYGYYPESDQPMHHRVKIIIHSKNEPTKKS